MSKQQQQAGIVSIIVATMLIIIVSLIVIAFAQVSRREQRESLDAQLSAQAYYAAETGVNAATAIVQSTDPALLTAQPPCNPTGPFSGIVYDLSPTPGAVAITCLAVDPAPPELGYQLHTDSGVVIPVLPSSAAGGATIQSLTFTWPKSNTNATSNCNSTVVSGAWQLPTEAAWSCPYAAIRADFVPGGTLNRDFLIANDKVSFMLPTATGLGTGKLNDVSAAQCGASSCKVTYNLLGLGASSMYLRLVSLYEGEETVTISGQDSSGAKINFTKAQARIDSTGRAQDVLRRIVVSVPLQSGNDTVPVQALVSGDSVCKRFGVFGNGSVDFYQNYAPVGSGCD